MSQRKILNLAWLILAIGLACLDSPSAQLPVRVYQYPPDADGIVQTGLESDLAIRGRGWFVLRDPATGDELFTRMGDFRLDDNNYVVTAGGLRMQGFNTPDFSAAGSRGDIQIDDRFSPLDRDPDTYMTSFRVASNGVVWIQMCDGSHFARAQILLQDFAAPEELERVEYNVFAATPAAGAAGDPAAPQTAPLGHIESGALLLQPLPPQLSPLPSTTNSPASVIGAVTPTDNPTDLAIRGPGCFLIRDPVSSELFATRAGAFLIDSNNFLITYDRKRVQGFNNLGETNIGDIRIALPEANAWWTNPDAVVTTFSFDRNGVVRLYLSDGTEGAIQQVLLWNFARPEQLRRSALGQFANVAAARPDYIRDPGRFGANQSRIVSGLELINVTSDLLAHRRSLKYFPQGAIRSTHNLTDLGIAGPGFFLLREPQSGAQFATRNGRFHFDHQGFLVNHRGLRVQGSTDGSRTNLGDVRIVPELRSRPLTLTPIVPKAGLNITSRGEIWSCSSDGSRHCVGWILLQYFRESFQLRSVGDWLYANLSAAGPELPGERGMLGEGEIQSFGLEQPPEPLQLKLPPRDGFRLRITGEPGSRWTIQATENFVSWHNVGVITNAGFESEFCDRTAVDQPQRFYRVKARYPAMPMNGLIRGGPIAVPVGPTPDREEPPGFRGRAGKTHELHPHRPH